MSSWTPRASGASCPDQIEGCFTILAKLLQFCGLCRPRGYATTRSDDADGRPQGSLATPTHTPLASRSPEPSLPPRTALLQKARNREAEPQRSSRTPRGVSLNNNSKDAAADQEQHVPGTDLSRKSGKAFSKAASAASLAGEDEDFCSTCLEGYTIENPKIWTNCGHHYHLGCIYEWMERKQTCPICDTPMKFEELL